jgi:hypothetical protein
MMWKKLQVNQRGHAGKILRVILLLLLTSSGFSLQAVEPRQ